MLPVVNGPIFQSISTLHARSNSIISRAVSGQYRCLLSLMYMYVHRMISIENGQKSETS